MDSYWNDDSLLKGLEKQEEEMERQEKRKACYELAGDKEHPQFISVHAADGSFYHVYYSQLHSGQVIPFEDKTQNKTGYLLELITGRLQLMIYLINFNKTEYLLFDKALQLGRVKTITEYAKEITETEDMLIKVQQKEG